MHVRLIKDSFCLQTCLCTMTACVPDHLCWQIIVLSTCANAISHGKLTDNTSTLVLPAQVSHVFLSVFRSIHAWLDSWKVPSTLHDSSSVGLQHTAQAGLKKALNFDGKCVIHKHGIDNKWFLLCCRPGLQKLIKFWPVCFWTGFQACLRRGKTGQEVCLALFLRQYSRLASAPSCVTGMHWILTL